MNFPQEYFVSIIHFPSPLHTFSERRPLTSNIHYLILPVNFVLCGIQSFPQPFKFPHWCEKSHISLSKFESNSGELYLVNPRTNLEGKKRTSYDQGYVSSLSSTSSRKVLWYWILSNIAYFATCFSENQKLMSSPFLWPLFQCIKYLILSRSLAWSTIFAFQVVWNSHFWRMDF